MVVAFAASCTLWPFMQHLVTQTLIKNMITPQGIDATAKAFTTGKPLRAVFISAALQLSNMSHVTYEPW